MPIRNPDGSLFTLDKPNPALLSQGIWDDVQVIQNFDYEELSYIPSRWRMRPTTVPPPTPVQTEAPPPQSPPPPTVVVEEAPPARIEFKPTDRRRLVCHVLPVEVLVTTDPLYGETQRRQAYGTQFTMEVEFRDSNDFSCLLWTNSIKELRIGSIIFVSEDRQWWQVRRVSEEDGGLLIECMVSSQNPSFAT